MRCPAAFHSPEIAQHAISGDNRLAVISHNGEVAMHI